MLSCVFYSGATDFERVVGVHWICMRTCSWQQTTSRCCGVRPYTWASADTDSAVSYINLNSCRLTCAHCTCTRKPDQPSVTAKHASGNSEDRQREDHAAAAEKRAKVLAAERQAELTAEIGRILDAESPHEVFEVSGAPSLVLMK